MIPEEIEQWKLIEEMPNKLHYISNLGNIKRVEGLIRVGGFKRLVPEIILKPRITHGYRCITYRHSGKNKTLRIGRTVGNYFIPNPDKKPFINHIDGNKLNDNSSNLEWVTNQENVDHAKRMGLIGKVIMPKEGKSKLAIPVAKYTAKGVFVTKYESITTAAKLNKIRGDGISKAIAGRLKTYHGFVWQQLKDQKPKEE